MPEYDYKAVTKKVYLALAEHKLNGNFVGTWMNQDSTIPGIKLFAGQTLTNCEDVADGYFMCEVCTEPVAVKVEKKHAVLTWTWEIEPTCSTNGVLVGKCSVETCGADIYDYDSEKVQATGEHEIKYSFYPVGGPEDPYIMTYDCPGCDDPKYNDAVGLVVTGVKTSIVKSTCSVQGTITYSYKLDGKIVTAVEKLELAPHTLNGEAVKEWCLDYDLVPGLKLFAGANLVCGTTVSGYYFCEVCDEAVSVDVEKNHRGSWTWTEKDADGNFIVPTCYNGAERVMAECLDCGCKNICEYIPSLEHVLDCGFDVYMDYKYQELVGTVYVYCVLCGEWMYDTDISAIPELAYLTIKDASYIVKPTCKAGGYAAFEVNIDGVVYVFDAYIHQLEHLAQADLRSTDRMLVASRINENGEVEYYAVYECPTCGDFYVLENVDWFYFTSANKEDVEYAIADFKEYLRSKEEYYY